MQQAIQTSIDDSLAGALEVAERLGARLRGAVRGRDEVVELVLIALLADGHVLLVQVRASGQAHAPGFGFACGHDVELLVVRAVLRGARKGDTTAVDDGLHRFVSASLVTG